MQISKQYIKGVVAGLSIIVLIWIVFLAGNYFSGSKEYELPNDAFDESLPKNVTVTTYGPEDHILGPTMANVLMISYADLDCPHCEYHHAVLQQIVDGYAGKVAWVYRHYPASGKSAENKAIASECAADLGGNKSFWRYIDALYANVDKEDIGFTDEVLIKLAGDIDLEESEFAVCLESGEHKETVQKHLESGIAAGVSGTPTTFVVSRGKQHTLIGAVTFEEVFTAIQSFTFL